MNFNMKALQILKLMLGIKLGEWVLHHASASSATEYQNFKGGGGEQNSHLRDLWSIVWDQDDLKS